MEFFRIVFLRETNSLYVFGKIATFSVTLLLLNLYSIYNEKDLILDLYRVTNVYFVESCHCSILFQH